MYSKGSLNSSSVGLYVGASSRPWGRILLVDSRLAVSCPLLSTLVKSRGIEFIALKGSGAAAGLFDVLVPFGFPRIEGALLVVPLAGEARIVELEAAVVIGTCTILPVDEGRKFEGTVLVDRTGIHKSQELYYRHRTSE